MKTSKVFTKIMISALLILVMLWQAACANDEAAGFVLPKKATMAEAYIKALKSQCETLTDEQVTDGIQMLSQKRIEEIRNTQTEVEITGTKYYVAEDGNDLNDGLSPEKPWKTLEKVSNAALNPGDGIFLKRGDIFTGQLMAKEGVTYSAYGEGEKPRLYAYPINVADASLWQATEVENIWVYTMPVFNDIGNIVFDGTSNARKIYRSEAGYGGLDYHTKREFNTWRDLTDDLSFYHDHDTDDKVYLKCEAGNPGEIYEEIRLVPKVSLIRVLENDNVTIDNLHIAYANYGVSAYGNTGLTVQNCEINWIGGCIQRGPFEYSPTRAWPTPHGNGIEVYGEAKNFTVDNCYIWQVYDAAMTCQGSSDGNIAVENVRYTNNVVEKAVYAIEIFYGKSNKESDVRSVDGIYIENNILRMGGGFGHFARPDQGVTALIRNGGIIDNTTNYMVTNNIFDRSMGKIIEAQNDGGSKAMYYDNIYVQKRSLVFANRLGKKYLADANLAALLAETNTEQNPTYIIVEELGYDKY